MLLDVLLIVHILGLLLGAGGGFASMLVMRRALASPPDQAATLRGLGPLLARMSTTGLVLMWLTGGAMVSLVGGFANLPPLFWAKFAFVLSLTVAAIAIEFTYADIKKGNVKAAARLPMLGPIAGPSSLLAVIFAVLTFH